MALDQAVLAAETERLLGFGRVFPHPGGGSYWLDSVGQPDPAKPVLTWITGRMAHVYALGSGLPARAATARENDARLCRRSHGAA